MPEWAVGLLVATIFYLLGLFTKNFLPSYMDEKGKNLATKEDIQKVTELTEEVQQSFKKELELFNSDLRFKYEFYYKQYDQLYSYLYAVIVQSEYVRKYIRIVKGQDFNLDDEPFITITPIHRQTHKLEYKQRKPARITGSSQEIETPVSKFNFDTLIDEIIQNGAIADQDLLKLAVSYRFAHFVSNAEDGNEKAAEEETGKQTEIIKTIVKTYNKLRCELKMDYVQSEKETGIISLTMVNISRMGCKKEYINRI